MAESHKASLLDKLREKSEALRAQDQAARKPVEDALKDIDRTHVPKALHQAARQAWDECVELGEAHGYRNAQATVLAPSALLADGLAKALFVLGEEAFPVLRAFRARGLLFTPEGPVAGP